MPAVDLERYALTKNEQHERLDQIRTLKQEARVFKAQAEESVRQQRLKEREASKLGQEVRQARLVEDPLICEQHGFESIRKVPGAMSTGAMIHINDGKVCSASALGHRSDMDPEWLETYRQLKAASPRPPNA